MLHLSKIGISKLSKLHKPAASFPCILSQCLATKIDAQPEPETKKSLADEIKIQKFNERAEYTTPGTMHYPSYLNKGEPFPSYERLEINLNGYEYTSLHVFFKYVEKLCKALGVTVSDAFEVPARSYDIKTLRAYSQTVENEYKLKLYHRIVRISDLKSTAAPVLLEAIQLHLPEGVSVEVRVPNADVEEFRYIPDLELNELRKSLDDINNPRN